MCVSQIESRRLERQQDLRASQKFGSSPKDLEGPYSALAYERGAFMALTGAYCLVSKVPNTPQYYRSKKVFLEKLEPEIRSTILAIARIIRFYNIATDFVTTEYLMEWVAQLDLMDEFLDILMEDNSDSEKHS